MKYIIGLVYVVLLLTSCKQFNTEDVINKKWKYGSGFYINDVLTLYPKAPNRLYDKAMQLDSLGVVRKNEERIFKIVESSKKKLVIEDLSTGEEGYYFDITPENWIVPLNR